MGENMHIIVESFHADGRRTLENALNLDVNRLAERQVVEIDISERLPNPKDYEEEFDPTLYKSEKTGRGPFVQGWQETTKPVMTCYKLCDLRFKWFGLQNRVEGIMEKEQLKLLWKFHQKLVCMIDHFHGLTMEDIREIERKAKEELDAKLDQANLEGREKKQ